MSVFALPEPDVVTLAGLRFAALTEGEVVHRVRTALAKGLGGRIATPNVDIVRHALLDPSVRADLETADLLVADGAPLVWASRLAGTRLPERVTGAGLIWSLSEGLGRDGSSVYLLGGTPGGRMDGAARAASALASTFPGLRIAGHESPRFGFDRNPSRLRRVLSRVVDAEPDVVFVGLGFPKQERIIEQLRSELPASWFLGCGAAINFVAGDLSRAPVWMQRCGLEWAHRLACEPRRLASRYLRHDAPYAVRLLTGAALSRERIELDDDWDGPIADLPPALPADALGSGLAAPAGAGRHRARARPRPTRVDLTSGDLSTSSSRVDVHRSPLVRSTPRDLGRVSG